jgi:peroxidase
MDLVALNIQRGRDHGLPSYNEYRDLCRLGKARTFGELAPIIPYYKTQHLQQIYGSVDDIDLFIGGIHETPVEGALVGPTFLCIIGDQFARLKKSDRYFYDVGGTPHSFTKGIFSYLLFYTPILRLC